MFANEDQHRGRTAAVLRVGSGSGLMAGGAHVLPPVPVLARSQPRFSWRRGRGHNAHRAARPPRTTARESLSLVCVLSCSDHRTGAGLSRWYNHAFRSWRSSILLRCPLTPRGCTCASSCTPTHLVISKCLSTGPLGHSRGASLRRGMIGDICPVPSSSSSNISSVSA